MRPKVKVTGGQRSRSQEVKGQGHIRSKVTVTRDQRSRSQEAKGQGHTRPRIDFKAWQRYRVWTPLGRVDVLVIIIVVIVNYYWCVVLKLSTLCFKKSSPLGLS